MEVGNAEHMADVLLQTTEARRGRCLLPRLAQLPALFTAAGQMHRKQFCSGQHCQPGRQQDISGARKSLMVSSFSITPSP